MGGVFIQKGTTIALGELVGNSRILHVRFDVTATWLSLAIRHLRDAITARVARNTAWAGTDEGLKAQTLEQEFESAMQAIVAAAICIDTFYALVKRHIVIPPGTHAAWNRNRTARYARIGEMLRHAFVLNNRDMKNLRQALKEIFRFRDMIVHPDGQIQPSIQHPELGVGTEWRFIYFRTTNAEAAVKVVNDMIWEFAFRARCRNPNVETEILRLRDRLNVVFPGGRPL